MTMTNDEIRAQLTIARGALNAIDTGLGAVAPPPAPAIRVSAGGNLQAAIDAASLSGQDVLVAPGTYPTFQLRGRTPNQRVVTIRPDVDQAQFPPTGTRPLSMPPVIIAPVAGSNLGIGTDKGAAGYALQWIGVSSPGINGQMVAIEAGATQLADFPSNVALLSCWLDGGNACKRGVQANGANLSILDSVIKGVMKTGQDTQAVGGALGPGPFLIQNNYLSASGETVLFGGDDPVVSGLIPSDIVIRGNYLTKDLAWQSVKATVKNALELKNCQRVLVENNVIEYAWLDMQTGYLIQITVRNQNGKAPWSTIQGVEIRYNVCRHANQWVNVLGQDDDKDASGTVYPSVPLDGLNVHHNLAYDVGGAAWGGGSTHAIGINNGPRNVTFDHNSVIGATSAALAMSLGTAKAPAQRLQVTNQILPEGNYGITGDGTPVGAASWSAVADAASVFDYNLISQGSSGRKITYPGSHNLLGPTVAAADHSVTPTLVGSDGQPVGADLAVLVARIPAYDASK